MGSAAARTLADLLGGHPYSHPIYAAWNAGMRLGLYVVVAVILTVLKQYVQHERAMARIDQLTGAANMRAFGEILKSELDRSLRYKRPFTISYFDLDNFKAVNDTFGHGAGDELLQTAVSVTHAHIRASDSVARLGGDEFALLLPETDQQAARAAITKILSHFGREMAAHKWPVTVSVGALTCLGGAQSVDDLIRRADELMYKAKADGKNRAQFSTCSEEDGALSRPI